jgi:hypothetical protein
MREVLAILLLFTTLHTAPSVFAQQNPNNDQSPILKTIGNGHMFGRRAAFRTYATTDGTEALVWYGTLQSEQEVKDSTERWLKSYTVTSNEPAKDPNGKVIGDRIIASPKQAGNAFVVIRRYGLNYWIIQSVSPDVAMQVEEMIAPPPSEKR